MIDTLLSRLLSAPDSPTADLYFRNACGDLLGSQVRQIAPTVFLSDEACLVMRHAMRSGPLPQGRRLIYMLDDDVDAGVADMSLPFLYRQKLRMVERPAGKDLVRRADIAVVSSPLLEEMLSRHLETHLMMPYWSEGLAPLDHFDRAVLPGGRFEIAYLGSFAHRSDLQFLLPVLANLLARFETVHVHVPQRHALPSPFDLHPRVHRIPGLGWTEYRTRLTERRFHVALYPLLDTPFNRARSPNKLIEHAVVGAAPIYSAEWRETERIVHGASGLCLPNTQHAWVDAIAALIRAPERARHLAEGARAVARRLNDPGPQRALWRQLLGVQERSVA
ncbi:MAG: hypothetical protein AAGD13_15675 [Pseudomonadota bacterium]